MRYARGLRVNQVCIAHPMKRQYRKSDLPSGTFADSHLSNVEQYIL